MDRETAAATYEAFVATLSDTGIPTRTGMDNIVSAIKSQGRFVDRKITFEDIADDSLAKEVAKELGYKFDGFLYRKSDANGALLPRSL